MVLYNVTIKDNYLWDYHDLEAAFMKDSVKKGLFLGAIAAIIALYLLFK